MVKRRLMAGVFIAVVFAGLFIIQAGMKISLKPDTTRREADAIFKSYSLAVGTEFYPVGFFADVRISDNRSSDQQMLLSGISDSLQRLDRQTYGDQFIILGSAGRGKGVFSISCNGRATPEKLKSLVEKMPELDSSTVTIDYPPKVFYVRMPLLTAMYATYRLRHDPQVMYVETMPVSLLESIGMIAGR